MNGYLLITLPFVWDEHEIPYDFARYTSFGIKHILETHGFEVVDSKKTTNYVETIFQMWGAYVSQHILKNKILRILLNPLIVFPIILCGIILSKILPANSNFYHNNIVLARKIVAKT